eukprot:scaffold451_cov365-Prasinococcus_capsulatus_cf.AAC.12
MGARPCCTCAVCTPAAARPRGWCTDTTIVWRRHSQEGGAPVHVGAAPLHTFRVPTRGATAELSCSRSRRVAGARRAPASPSPGWSSCCSSSSSGGGRALPSAPTDDGHCRLAPTDDRSGSIRFCRARRRPSGARAIVLGSQGRRPARAGPPRSVGGWAGGGGAAAVVATGQLRLPVPEASSSGSPPLHLRRAARRTRAQPPPAPGAPEMRPIGGRLGPQ